MRSFPILTFCVVVRIQYRFGGTKSSSNVAAWRELIGGQTGNVPDWEGDVFQGKKCEVFFLGNWDSLKAREQRSYIKSSKTEKHCPVSNLKYRLEKSRHENAF